MIKGQILLKKTTFNPIKFFCEKRDGHSIRKRTNVIAPGMLLLKQQPAAKIPNNGFSAKRHVTCHVTCQTYQFYFKCSGR